MSCVPGSDQGLLHRDSPIIWHDEDQSIILIDVPRSIESAQTTRKQGRTLRYLRSAQPLQQPFSSNEPKSAKKRNKLPRDNSHEDLHAGYVNLLQNALNTVRDKHAGIWCLPRPFALTDVLQRKRRSSPSGDEVGDLPREVLQAGLYTTECHLDTFQDLTRFGSLACNDGELTKTVTHAGHDFVIPPRSSFFLSDCRHSDVFRTSIRAQAHETDQTRSFDIIILDPPWPSRSVRRTHKTAGSTYTIASTPQEVRDLLLSMDLDMLMHDSSLVGIWITNKPAVRDMILGPGGVFELWNVTLTEEWLWLKTTQYGEPVVPLDGVWRKPFEVFLLGQRKSTACDSSNSQTKHNVSSIKRRVVIGVPDLHSRKPCLKPLLEQLVLDCSSYRALEIFARYLVADWWSWGNECIKFNCRRYWLEQEMVDMIS